MHYCPRCNAEVPAEARFCRKCGYNQINTQLTPVAPTKSEGLIRPIGPGSWQRSSASSTSGRSWTDLPVTPPVIPAHLLDLTPMTPPELPSLNKQASKPRRPQQFLQPAFLPSKPQRPGPQDISEQQTHQEPVFFAPTIQQSPAPPTTQPLVEPPSTPPPEHAVQSAALQAGKTPSIEDLPTAHYPIEVVKGRPPVIETHSDFDEFEDNFESYVATSKAAEHWRTSWRNRQREEAGPATFVTRGQSSVPEPLMAMQDSLARIRAIMAPRQKQNKPHDSLGFWITFFLILILIIGLGAYIASTYLFHALY